MLLLGIVIGATGAAIAMWLYFGVVNTMDRVLRLTFG
jgi:hypothetical protein